MLVSLDGFHRHPHSIWHQMGLRLHIIVVTQIDDVDILASTDPFIQLLRRNLAHSQHPEESLPVIKLPRKEITKTKKCAYLRP
mgnify:CR=1 FL=1